MNIISIIFIRRNVTVYYKHLLKVWIGYDTYNIKFNTKFSYKYQNNLFVSIRRSSLVSKYHTACKIYEAFKQKNLPKENIVQLGNWKSRTSFIVNGNQFDPSTVTWRLSATKHACVGEKASRTRGYPHSNR